jgi:hypothetical protein
MISYIMSGIVHVILFYSAYKLGYKMCERSGKIR